MAGKPVYKFISKDLYSCSGDVTVWWQ